MGKELNNTACLQKFLHHFWTTSLFNNKPLKKVLAPRYFYRGAT